jgi:hypothetical protein
MTREQELLQALMGTECICGAAKGVKMSHCRGCYFALPGAQRKALYRRIGEGYAEAFDASLATLRKLGRIA